jgi:hypothetical protein
MSSATVSSTCCAVVAAVGGPLQVGVGTQTWTPAGASCMLQMHGWPGGFGAWLGTTAVASAIDRFCPGKFGIVEFFLGVHLLVRGLDVTST